MDERPPQCGDCEYYLHECIKGTVAPDPVCDDFHPTKWFKKNTRNIQSSNNECVTVPYTETCTEAQVVTGLSINSKLVKIGIFSPIITTEK